jgi:hypothetical protein
VVPVLTIEVTVGADAKAGPEVNAIPRGASSAADTTSAMFFFMASSLDSYPDRNIFGFLGV